MFAAENGLKDDPRLKSISDSIRVVPHFPKHGIMFQDITTLLSDHKAFKNTIDIFVERYRFMAISAVAGVEARGFMFAAPIAYAIGAKFIPLRKPGKLPGDVISEAYELEYGSDRLEMHVGAVEPGERVLVIDDLVATGGTLTAAINLIEHVGAEVVECACVVGVPEFKVTAYTHQTEWISWFHYFDNVMIELDAGASQTEWKTTIHSRGASTIVTCLLLISTNCTMQFGYLRKWRSGNWLKEPDL